MRIDRAGHGICGSFVDIRETPRCTDDPEHLLPQVPRDDMMRPTDNLGICMYRTCACDRDCTGGSGYVCVTAPAAVQRLCGWPDVGAGEHSTPCGSDAGTPTDAPTDAEHGGEA
jgi:hypothetical protein